MHGCRETYITEFDITESAIVELGVKESAIAEFGVMHGCREFHT